MLALHVQSAAVAVSATFFFIVLLYVIFLESFARRRLPKGLPTVGFGSGPFFASRASISQLLVTLNTVDQGYRQYGARQHAFVIPTPSFRPLVLLPQQYVQWLARQPESILDHEPVNYDRQSVKYFPFSFDFKKLQIAMKMSLTKGLNLTLDASQPHMYKCIQDAIDSGLGTDAEGCWKEVRLIQRVREIADNAVISVFLGSELSNDKAFRRLLHHFYYGLGILLEFVGLFPVGLLRLIVANSLYLYLMAVKKICITYYLRSVISKRIAQLDSRANDVDESSDFVVQCIRTVRKLEFPLGRDEATFISELLMFLVAVGGLSINSTLVACAVHIFGHEGQQQNIYSVLRQEAESIFKSDADWTSPNSLECLVNIDSCVRETGRLNPTLAFVLTKQVIPKDGIMLPDGSHVPHGTWVGVPAEAIHTDDSIYPDAHTFDALRFANMRVEGKPNRSLESSEPNDTYFFFSYGRAACRGRWFATRVIKLFLAYLILHYDIKPLQGDIKKYEIADTQFYDSTAEMVVRKRKLN
ncbi:cytochrome P450 [Xylaria bambusicola]|uniref:cytochrome P450 n=1 Tax=Xylaria bambusicola TaxID=326684 RepID=UPI002007F2A2|nr:cytochrome P450 [Xylaria bambusicola]KAI0506203.1 cytochrome P450 [Xylaria bambusicola]